MINTKTFAGALVAAGLMAACGGEVGSQGDDTGVNESAVVKTLVTRTVRESITCDLAYYSRTYYVGSVLEVEQCQTAADLTHQYRTGQYITYKTNQNMYVEADGLVGSGIITTAQSLYTGTVNGYVTFQGNQHIALAGSYGSARVLNGGILAEDQCLLGLTGSYAPVWRACAGGYNATFYGDSSAYLYTCTTTTNITCP